MDVALFSLAQAFLFVHFEQESLMPGDGSRPLRALLFRRTRFCMAFSRGPNGIRLPGVVISLFSCSALKTLGMSH